MRDLNLPTKLFLACAAVAAVMAGMSALSIGMLGQLAAALVCAGVLAAAVGGALARRLDQSNSLIGDIAGGRLENAIESDRGDEVGQLFRSLSALQRRLRTEREERQAETANAARNAGASAATQVQAPVADASHELVNIKDGAELSAVIQAALHGDLIDRVKLQGKSGFLATLSGSVNELLDSMANAIRQIQTVSGEVNRGAEAISAGNSNLSQRTEEQSSSLEETATSMEQMTATVKQNAENAGQANQLAIAARGQAESGGSVVGKAVRAMAEINEASRKIADIIGVIDEIAFQTNLLALNAAVEAARAGEQGRGFAVVASEVRGLAGRSATAAKEIKALIQDSVRKVEDGSTLVTESGQTLEQIVVSVKKVSDIVAEIAAASREQSSGIEQVNRAVMQMDELTQQNGTLVEEARAASRTLAEQARNLSNMMERYRVSGGTSPAHRSPAPAPVETAPA
ncbi:MAG TPA: methyl-accepting chemotaxis protein, partial [Steroidobacteraceae bacterium]|nr:methyl-accepting chemotaxis protein [Steroidobacteraceae bacterium]